MRIVVATHNPGKLAEIGQVLEGLGVDLVAAGTLGLEAPEEPAATFVENALIKARAASLATGLPALADDSGLIVDALGGAPGLHSAYYGGVHGDHARNLAKLHAELAPHPRPWRARFCTVVVLLRSATDPAPIVAEGRWEGEVVPEARGHGGFGYDPVFLDPTLGRTAAELEPAEKNARSARGRALAALRAALHAAMPARA